MINCEEIVEKISTPSFLYDIATLFERIEYLKMKLPNVNMVYAVKANTFIVKEIEHEVDKYEICSPGEFEICHNLKIDHKKMVISGVYKERDTIEKMISNYPDILNYTIESITQYELLKELATKYQRKIHVLIRLTSGNQFGVNEDEFKRIIQEKVEFISIDGIEYFSGTQKHSIKRINREIDYLNEFVNEIEKEFDFEIKEIEYGPGLPIFYFQDDNFDEETFLSEVNLALNKIKGKKVSLEIGRSIVANSGLYFTKVVDIKSNKNGNFVILDGGINHLVYYGQTMAMKIPYMDVFPKREGVKNNYNLYGSLCTINDVLVKNITLNEIKKNDVFVFKNVGAYSSTEGIALFLSRDLPQIILRDKKGELKTVREITKTSELNFPRM